MRCASLLHSLEQNLHCLCGTIVLDLVSAMHELDGDSVRISSRGRFAERDIVQFVAFRDFLGNQNAAQDKARLAKEVLAEIPDQLIGYMDKRGIRPRPASAPSHA